MAWVAPLGTALALSLAAPAPEAEPDPRVGALALRLPEDVSDLDREGLNQRFADGVTRSGLTTEPLPSTVQCDDPGCYQQAAKTAGVDLLVAGTVEQTGPDFAVHVYAVSGETGEVLAQVDGGCEICGIGELSDVVGSLAARLRPTLDNATQPTTLTIESDPAEAEVWIDGVQVGTTPLQIRVAPGKHEVNVVKRGRRTEHVEVSLRPGINQSFSFRLARSSRFPRWVPWAGIGGGVVALGAGIGLLVVDENPIQRDCNADVDGRCQYLRDTIDGGVVLTVVGVALVGTSVGLLLTQRRQDRLQRSGVQSRLRLVPGLRGASLVGRF